MGSKQTSSKQTLSSQLYNIHPQLKTSIPVNTNCGPMLQFSIPITGNTARNLQHYLTRQKQISQQWVSRYLLLPEKTLIETKTCGTSETLVLYFEFFPFRLDRQIEARRTTHRQFDESEVWYILYAGASAIFEFEKRSQILGKITPQNVLLNSQGHIRFINKYSWPGAEITRDNFYSSPEQFTDKPITHSKSSMFNLGLVVLECMTLEDTRWLYNDGFDTEKFYLIVQIMNSNQQFSSYLKGVVRRMIELRAEERVAGVELFQELKRFENQILFFIKFT